MIVVDSTAWIDFLRGRSLPHVRALRSLLGVQEIVIGDLMLCEVLQGLSDEQHAVEVETFLRQFVIVPVVDDAIAIVAARNFRTLRARGITIRTTIDLLIGTWCIEHRLPLLHNDRDFVPMTKYLGLMEVPVDGRV